MQEVSGSTPLSSTNKARFPKGRGLFQFKIKHIACAVQALKEKIPL